MKPRILHVIPSLQPSGTAGQFFLLVEHLQDEFDFDVFALEGGPAAVEVDKLRIRATTLGSGRAGPQASLKLRRLIGESRPALVHTWRRAGAWCGVPAARAAGCRRIVASRRCGDVPASFLGRAWDRWVLRGADRVVVDSVAVQAEHEQVRIARDKLRVIPSGVRLTAPDPGPRQTLLAELGLPADARLVCYAGSLTPRKRIKELIWAIEQLNVVHDFKLHLLIVGAGPQLALLKRYRRLFHIENHVHFLGVRYGVPRLLAHSDVLWLASGREGLAISILEAMAAGVPVVATDVPGNRELVVPGETGFLVEPNVRSAFARYTHKILSDGELAQRFAAAGRERIVQFSAQRMAQRYAELYRELLADAGP